MSAIIHLARDLSLYLYRSLHLFHSTAERLDLGRQMRGLPAVVGGQDAALVQLAVPLQVQEIGHGEGQPVRAEWALARRAAAGLCEAFAAPQDGGDPESRFGTLAVARVVAGVADFLPMIGQVHPRRVRRCIGGRVFGRLRRAARLLRCAQQLRDHAIVIEQRRIVFLAEVADPGGATLRGELLLHLVVLVVERILVLGKAQAVVRVRAQ